MTELERITDSVSDLAKDLHQTDRLLHRLQEETLLELHSSHEVGRLHLQEQQLKESLDEQEKHLRQMQSKAHLKRQVQNVEKDIEKKNEELLRTRQDLQCRLKSAGQWSIRDHVLPRNGHKMMICHTLG